MATQTYDLLGSTTLVTATNNVTISSISQSYGDLIVVVDANGDGVNAYITARVNADGGSNYKSANISTLDTLALNSVWQSSLNAAAVSAGYLVQGTSPGTLQLQIMDYTATNKYKEMLHRFDQSNNGMAMGVSRWNSTAAVNSVTILGSGNFGVGSTFKIYGVIK